MKAKIQRKKKYRVFFAKLASSAQFYLLIFYFNHKSKIVKMCKKNFDIFLQLEILRFI